MVLFILGFAGIGVLYASILEWLIHKYFMHTPKLFYHAFDRHQLQHHVARKSLKRFYLRPPEIPEYKLSESSFMPWLFVIHMPLFLLLGWAFGWAAGVGFALGSGVYLLMYELMHWSMHVPGDSKLRRWVDGTRYFKYITELHRIHHYRAWQNYNVVLPLADVLFRTLNHDWLEPEPAVNVSEEDERGKRRASKPAESVV